MNPHPHNITLARDFMEKAGYEYFPEEPSLSQKVGDALIINPIILITIFSLVAITGFTVDKYNAFKLK